MVKSLAGISSEFKAEDTRSVMNKAQICAVALAKLQVSELLVIAKQG